MGKPSAPASSSSVPLSSSDFGACTNPGITYDTSHYHHSFVPSNTDHFPLDASPDIASLESDICDRLEEDECDASSRAIEACHKARWMFSGYAGQEAADAWNRAMAVGNNRLSTPPVSSATRSATRTVLVPVEVSSSSEPATEATSAVAAESSDAESSAVSSTRSIRTATMTATSSPSSPSSPSSSASPPPSSTASRTSSARAAATNESSNGGSPFDPQPGLSSSPPARKPARTTVLGLMTVLLLLAPMV